MSPGPNPEIANSEAPDPGAPNPEQMPPPDTINPAAPPENPVPHHPQEDPPGQPSEVPGRPGGDDMDQPGKGPDEIPPP